SSSSYFSLLTLHHPQSTTLFPYTTLFRSPNGVTCPICGCKDVIFLANQDRWQCRNKHPKRQFSLKTGTIYEDSPLGLDKWLSATDRKSTRLNSSHVSISYAVFCLKKKKKK